MTIRVAGRAVNVQKTAPSSHQSVPHPPGMGAHRCWPEKASKCSQCSHCLEHYPENSKRDAQGREDMTCALRNVEGAVISTFWHLSKYGPPGNAFADSLTWF